MVPGDDPLERLERLDAWLVSKPDAGRFVPREQAEMERALGVA